jgi:hypothetical protein
MHPAPIACSSSTMNRQPVVASSAASISSPSRASQPAPEAEPVGGPDPTPAYLAGGRVERVERDLLSVLVKSHYDRHKGPPQAPRFETCADHPRLS